MTFFQKHKKLIIVLIVALLLDLITALIGFPVLSGLFLALQTSVLYIWLFYRASEQVLLPKDGLTGLRYIILSFILAALIFSIPSIVYTSCRLLGFEYEWLRGVVNVTGGLSRIAAPILLVLVFEYRDSDNH